MPRNPNCSLCPLHKSTVNRCIWGQGTGRAFIVGEAPGEAEARTGKPFQGKSGRILRDELERLGIGDAYITNVAKCRPPDNRKPEASEVKTCAPYLAEEIATRNPSHILLLGGTAMKAMIRQTKVTAMNGQIVPYKDGRTYVCSIHPAYVLRDPSQETAFRSALTRYAAVLNGTFTGDPEIKWRVITPKNVQEFKAQWSAAREASYDVETTGLDWWVEGFKINIISFRVYPGATWVLNLSLNPQLPDPASLLSWCVTFAPKRMISQNGKFDNLCLMKVYGLRFRNSFDTMLASHILDENSENDLKNNARIHLNAPDYDDLTLKEKQGEIEDPQRLYKYGAFDAYYTRELAPVFEDQLLKDPQLYRLYHKLVMPAARAFEEIEQNGNYVNIPLMDRMARQEQIALKASEAKLNRMAGKRINWNSPAQVADILYGKFKIPIRVRTPKGQPSTGEAALADIRHPIKDALVEYREHEKFLSTYLGDPDENTGGWRDFMDGPRLYLSTKIHGTVTGRYSSRLHQTPRDSTVRNCISAPPGWTLVVADFSQVELRIAAHFSKDPELMNCYRNGIDVHWRTLMNALASGGGGKYVDLAVETALKATLDSTDIDFPSAIEILTNMGPDEAQAIDKEWKEGRKIAKSENFGYVFGMYPKKYIEYAKTKYGFEPTMREAEQARERFFTLYRGLPAWHERQKKLVRLDGFVRNLYSRKRRLPAIHSRERDAVGEAEREGINAPVQGTVGDIKADALVEIHESFPRTLLRVTGEVHDSILMWIRTQYLNVTIPKVKTIMERPRLMREWNLELSVPLVADFEIGAWGAGRRWRPT